jgi:hypothetical protein
MPFYVNDKLIGGASDLLVELGIDQKLVPFRKRTKEFEKDMPRDINGNMLRDRDGNPLSKSKIAGKPEFTAHVPKYGYEVRIRYAETQRPSPENKEHMLYTPMLISLDPSEDGSIPMESEQQFVFWFLHPWNLHSPLHVKGSQAFYSYKDEDARSKSENDHWEAQINAVSRIVGEYALPKSQLKMVAKGLGIAGVDEMSDDTLRKKLRQLATADPINFVNKIESREIIFSGKIQEAIDRGIIALRTLNGMSRWYLNNSEIIPVPFGADDRSVLMDELSANLFKYIDEINASLENKTLASNLSNPEYDKFFEQSVPEVKQVAELSFSQMEALRKMQEDEAYAAKIKKLASYNIEDQGLHYAQRKSYNDNIEAIEAYKKSLQESPAEV